LIRAKITIFISSAQLIVALFLFSSNIHAAVTHYDGFTWKTLHTKNFRIHYHDGLETLARKAAAIAEDTHKLLAPKLEWQPVHPTHIIISDEIGLANGYATPIPVNRAAIFVTPPVHTSTLEDHGGWLETVIIHEYTHILHLDKVSGFPSILRKIFGRYPIPLPFTVFPNAFQPTWVPEGLSTYYETDKNRGMGRGQSTLFQMMIRMEVDKGVKGYRQVNQFTTEWPSRTIPYLYGVHFFNFVAEKRGKKYIQKMVADYSNDWFPYRINSNNRHVFGKNLRGIWQEYTDYLSEKYKPINTGIRKSGLVEGERLTDTGFFTGASRALDNKVYYIADDNLKRPVINVLNLESGEIKRLAKIHFGASIDLHADSGILLAQPEYCSSARLYYDLYRVNRKNGRQKRLTRCGQYHSATWSPDGKEIIATKIASGRTHLVRMSGEGRNPAILWSANDSSTLANIDWSPDGKYVVASMWRPESGWDLEEFDLHRKRWRKLSHQNVIELHPQYTTDNKSILYSADNGGVYNIRKLDRKTGRIETLSNVLGGAFAPSQDPDSKQIFYTGYHHNGTDIYQLAPTARVIKTTRAGIGPSAVARTDWPKPEIIKTSNYSPWSTVNPRWWFPYLVYDEAVTEIGVSTSGSDVLDRHSYFVTIASDVKNNWMLGSLDYIYDRWRPVFKYHVSRQSRSELSSDSEPERVRLDDVSQVELMLPLRRVDTTLTTHIAATSDRASDGWISQKLGIAEKPDTEDRLAGVALVYNSSRRFAQSISRSDGRQINAVAENSEMIDGGDYTGGIYTLDWREFWPLGGEHVLALRYVRGKSTDRPRLFELGGSDSSHGAPLLLGSTLVNTPFNRRRYALRGYPEGLPQLRGSQMELGSIEYRFPVTRIERGYTTPPIGIRQIHGAVFTDYGATWDITQKQADKYFAGAGVEARAELMLLYNINLEFRLGYAHGYHQGGANLFYLDLGTSF
jgi:hypothetical protein